MHLFLSKYIFILTYFTWISAMKLVQVLIIKIHFYFGMPVHGIVLFEYGLNTLKILPNCDSDNFFYIKVELVIFKCRINKFSPLLVLKFVFRSYLILAGDSKLVYLCPWT